MRQVKLEPRLILREPYASGVEMRMALVQFWDLVRWRKDGTIPNDAAFVSVMEKFLSETVDPLLAQSGESQCG